MTNRELEDLCQGAPPDATTTTLTDGWLSETERNARLGRMDRISPGDVERLVAEVRRLRASRQSSEPGERARRVECPRRLVDVAACPRCHCHKPLPFAAPDGGLEPCLECGWSPNAPASALASFSGEPAHETNEEMLRLIRAITDASGAADVPFLDDAVKVAIEKARSPGSGEEEGLRQAKRIFDVLLLKEAMLAAAESDLRAAFEGDLHVLKRRCSACGEDFYTPHAEHDICRKHAYVGPRTALSARADATKGGT